MTEKYLGESIPKLGFGYMRIPRGANGEFDLELIARMADRFLNAGFTYFDVAHMYEGCEEALRETLVKRHDRASFLLADKLPMAYIYRQEEMEKYFNESLQRCGTDYFDYYLLHALEADKIERCDTLGAWDFIAEKKAQGKIRHIGFSFHDTPEALDAILLKHPEAEFVQLQINYYDWENDAVRSRECYEVARKYNTPVIIMEPIKGGMLSSDTSPAKAVMEKHDASRSLASWAITFAAGLDGVITVLSGMNAMEQLEDNISTVKNLKPLTDSDYSALRQAVEALNAIPRIPCTGCGYCVSGCPQSILIPQLFECYNNYLMYSTTNNNEIPYRLATEKNGKARDCIECRACEDRCPQHIEITSVLKKVAEIYE